jgi:hypothetical protein
VFSTFVTLASRSRIPDQLKWAEYIGVSIVAQFLLFPHVEGEVLEGNLLSGVDCVIQGFSIDTEAVCENCGFTIYNDTLTCVQWCKYAKQCFGDTAYEALMKAARIQKERAVAGRAEISAS